MFRVGPEGKYSISEASIQHILNGDISERQDRDRSNLTILVPVIAGGLHTVDGAKEFLKRRPDIRHGLQFEPEADQSWYYARELQNGVILLKIPRQAFQSKAAKLTEFPETYYKSGYLWKTLFPKAFKREDILRVIDEALHRKDEEETKDDLIIGYTNTDDLFKVLKIRIQIRGTEIMSAFPTWGQPMTGNNGKPFSHIEAINTVISLSSVFLLGEDNFLTEYSLTCDELKLQDLYQSTPKFLLKRNKPRTDNRIIYRQVRAEYLQREASKLTENEIDAVVSLITRDEYLRYPFVVMNAIYGRCYATIQRHKEYANAVALYQNLYEALILLNSWDLLNNSRKAVFVIHRLLKTRFINTGGLDQWELKRLSNLIADIIKSYASPDVVFEYLSALSVSPVRVAFFVEFDVNPFFNQKGEIIGINDHWEKPMLFPYYLEYVVQNLGINYTLNFDADFNTNVARECQEDAGPKSLQMISQAVSHAVAKDFNLFTGPLPDLVEMLEITSASISVIDDILYDYHRTLSANIQRIFVKHRKILSAPPDDDQFGTREYNRYTKAKHEHMYLSMMNQLAVERVAKHLEKSGFTKEATGITGKYIPVIPEVMKIPIPKSVPGCEE